MKYKEAEKIKIGDMVFIKNDYDTYTITGITKYEKAIVFESDGGVFYHKDIEDVIR